MYCPDTLKRLNDEAVDQYHEQLANDELTCDYCDKPATDIRELYNPADEMRNPPVSGVYSTIALCEECRDKGYGDEEVFYCEGCDRWFIYNHSWDVLAVQTEYGLSCQKCAAEEMEGEFLVDVLGKLRRGSTEGWKRINGMPDKTELWGGEFSQYGDFPGYTSLDAVADSLEEAAREKGLRDFDRVFPIIDHGYQFSVSLAVYF